MAALVVCVPLLARGFGANSQQIGLLAGVYQWVLLRSGVVLGRWTSYGDRKRFAVCGTDCLRRGHAMGARLIPAAQAAYLGE